MEITIDLASRMIGFRSKFKKMKYRSSVGVLTPLQDCAITELNNNDNLWSAVKLSFFICIDEKHL